MSERMTHRAKYYQVTLFVIVSILINMMNSQYLRMFIIPTFLAFFDHIPSKHIFSDCRKASFPFSFIRFINTSTRTIYSSESSIRFKMFITVLTFIFNGAFSCLSFMITFSRAIFGLINSCCNKFEFFTTYYTVFLKSLSGRVSSAFIRAKFSNLNSMFCSIELFRTNQTIFINSSVRFIRHAIKIR